VCDLDRIGTSRQGLVERLIEHSVTDSMQDGCFELGIHKHPPHDVALAQGDDLETPLRWSLCSDSRAFLEV
jgi:hypothetical protein